MYLSCWIYNSILSFILCLVLYEISHFNWGIIRTKHTFLKFKVRLAILIQGLQQTLKKFNFISNKLATTVGDINHYMPTKYCKSERLLLGEIYELIRPNFFYKLVLMVLNWHFSIFMWKKYWIMERLPWDISISLWKFTKRYLPTTIWPWSSNRKLSIWPIH